MKEKKTKYVIMYIVTAAIVSIWCGLIGSIDIYGLLMVGIIMIITIGFFIMPMMLRRILE